MQNIGFYFETKFQNIFVKWFDKLRNKIVICLSNTWEGSGSTLFIFYHKLSVNMNFMFNLLILCVKLIG